MSSDVQLVLHGMSACIPRLDHKSSYISFFLRALSQCIMKMSSKNLQFAAQLCVFQCQVSQSLSRSFGLGSPMPSSVIANRQSLSGKQGES
jgi:hypothetical protein